MTLPVGGVAVSEPLSCAGLRISQLRWCWSGEVLGGARPCTQAMENLAAKLKTSSKESGNVEDDNTTNNVPN
jgi:hypothetical protein